MCLFCFHSFKKKKKRGGGVAFRDVMGFLPPGRLGEFSLAILIDTVLVINFAHRQSMSLARLRRPWVS